MTNPDLFSQVQADKVVLEKMQLAFWGTLSEYPFLADSARINLIEHSAHHLVMMLKAYVLRSVNRQEGVGSVDVPANWWEAFKAEKFPAWAKDKWPVKMKQVVYTYETVIKMCPHANQPFPGEHIVFMQYKDQNGAQYRG